MKNLLSIALLLFAFTVSAVDYRLYYTITVTNAPTEGDLLTINGTARHATNGTQSSLGFVVGADAGESATNLLTQLNAYPISTLNITRQGTNEIVLRSRTINTPLTVTSSGTWATLTLGSNTVANPIPVTVPVSNETVETNKTYVANGLITAIEDYADISFTDSATALAHYVSVEGTQTVSNKTIVESDFTGAFTGSLNSDEGTITNFFAYDLTVYSGTFSGSVGIITNGYLTNVFLSGFTGTNGVNYGNAFSSVGSAAAAEQFGDGAIASGAKALAVGNDALASGSTTVAIGYLSKATNLLAVAVGPSARAGEENTLALGASSKATNINGVAIGYLARTTDSNQVVLGSSVVDWVYTPGRIEAIGGYTNAFFTGTFSHPRLDVTSLANGNNAAVSPGERNYINVSGPTAAFTINGITGGTDGRKIIVQNSTGFSLTIANDSGVDPASSNRIKTGTGADVTVTNNPASLTFIYDTGVSRWILQSIPGDSVAGITAGARLGGGYPIFDANAGGTLNFNSITNNENITISTNANLFTIGVAAAVTNLTDVTGGGTATTAVKINNVKVYRALLTQTGTSAPTATVLENTLGGTVVWTREGNGDYDGTLSGAFTANKTMCFAGHSLFNAIVAVVRADANTINVTTSGEFVQVDEILSGTSIEILVYP